MATYALLADVDEAEFRNPHELSTGRGELRTDIAKHGGELPDTYATFDEFDFELLGDVRDPESALGTTYAEEHHGNRTRAAQAFTIDQLTAIVDDA